jgi:D-amino-acid dehydrogenase
MPLTGFLRWPCREWACGDCDFSPTCAVNGSSGNARNNIRLGLYSLECLRRWRERYGMEYRQTLSGSMQVYFSRELMAESVQFRRELLEGVPPIEPIGVDEVIAREPALAPVRRELAGAIVFPSTSRAMRASSASSRPSWPRSPGSELMFGTTVQSIRLTAVACARW